MASVNHLSRRDLISEPRSLPRSGDWIPFYTSITILSVIVTGFCSYALPELANFYLANLLTQLGLLWLCVSLKEQRPVSMANTLFVLWFIYNLVRGAQLTLADHTGDVRLYLFTMTDDDMTRGAVLVTAFVFAMAFGSHLHFGARRRTATRFLNGVRFSQSQVIPLAIVALVLSVAAIFLSTSGDTLSAKRVYETSSGVTTRFGPLTFALHSVLFYILGLSYYLFYSRAKVRYVLICGIAVTVVALVISLRTYLIFFMLPYAMVAVKRLSARDFAMILAAAPLVAFFVGYVTFERNNINSKVEIEPSEYISVALDGITLNANYGGYLATTMSSVAIENNAPILYGRTLFLDPLMQFVPRAVWPDKPEELGGELRPFLQDQALLPRNIAGGVPPGIVAEAWLNARTIGIVLLGLVMGLFAKSLALAQNRSMDAGLNAILSLVAVVVVFFWFGGHFARFFMTMVQFFTLAIPVGLLQRYLTGAAR